MHKQRLTGSFDSEISISDAFAAGSPWDSQQPVGTMTVDITDQSGVPRIFVSMNVTLTPKTSAVTATALAEQLTIVEGSLRELVKTLLKTWKQTKA